ncbi:alpha/beta fold hydrolase [Deinococcus sp.]|uniref:alpha/beta fold hydrolase n=1 Tax=Deinococcus sp. TaxID=47478 RepID=UPI00286E37FB|nr:alpha/beta fold hydrolase [Deinococcus sp.]
MSEDRNTQVGVGTISGGSARSGPGAFVLETSLGSSGVPVRLGVQSWGQLSVCRGNAVLVCHYYTGTSRAARVRPGDPPGWWESLIGPGRAIDTERYYVVCMNTPSNVQALDPEVVTAGPDTLDPDGQLWGERFPAWDFADLHAAQSALLRHLGAERWHAVVGPSFGGMQALQWAARTPELAPRVAAIVASPYAGPVLQDMFGPLLRDVSAAGGLEGALRLITLFGLGAEGIGHSFAPGALTPYLHERMQTASLSHIRDIARVVRTHDLRQVAPQEALFARWRDSGLRLLSANVLGDCFFPSREMAEFARAAQAAGVDHHHIEYASVEGHLGGLSDTGVFENALRVLLASPGSVPASPVHEVVHD